VVNDVVLCSSTSVDFCYSLDPTHDYSSLVAANVNPTDNNYVTFLTSNCTTAHHASEMQIKPSYTVANTGATSVFMDGIPTKNKWPALHPIQICLPDGRKVTSTHICNITIPGLPITLTGHIVPEMTMASLLGIRVLCKAGFVVVFDDKTC
jgi:hypothetical protein